MKFLKYLTEKDVDEFNSLSIALVKDRKKNNQKLLEKVEKETNLKLSETLDKSNKKIKKLISDGLLDIVKSENPFKVSRIKDRKKSEELKLELFELNDMLGEMKNKISKKIS
jgi:hypothetical protein